MTGKNISYLARPLLILLFTSSLFAQNATLRGQVTDESGAVIPGANVTLTGPAAQVRTTTADNSGSYSFADLTPGSYTVQAAAPSLAQASPAQVVLKAGVRILNL